MNMRRVTATAWRVIVGILNAFTVTKYAYVLRIEKKKKKKKKNAMKSQPISRLNNGSTA